MALKKDKGIIIYSKNLADSDKIISIASELEPRRKFYLRGIRKSKRRPIIASELGSYIELDYYEKLEKDIFEIKEINLIDRYDSLKSSIKGLYFISYISELADLLLPEGEIHTKESKLIRLGFDYANQNGFVFTMVPFMKARLLFYLGVLPSEFICLECNENVLHKEAAILTDSFEIHCGDCTNIENNQIHLIRLLHDFLTKKFNYITQTYNSEILIRESDAILNYFLKNYMQKYLKTEKDFYKII